MVSKTVDKSAKNKLYHSLFTYTRSLIRRGVAIIPIAHSGRFGSVEVTVVGVRGIVTKNVIVCFDNDINSWTAVSDGVEYTLSNLFEISVLLREKITQMNTVVTKL